MKLKASEFNGEILVFVEDENGSKWLVENVTAFELSRDGSGGVHSIHVDAIYQIEPVKQ